jgi:hypothetical protein
MQIKSKANGLEKISILFFDFCFIKFSLKERKKSVKEGDLLSGSWAPSRWRSSG